MTRPRGRYLALLLLAATPWPIAVANHERVIATRESRAGQVSLRDTAPWCDAAAESRTSLACARLAARRAAHGGKGASAEQALAMRDVDRALRGRPEWPAALVERAYVLELAGAPPGQVAAALERSYGAAPYLRAAAVWRVRSATRHWAALSANGRAAVIGEAQWYRAVDSRSNIAMSEAIAGTPVETALLLRAADAL